MRSRERRVRPSAEKRTWCWCRERWVRVGCAGGVAKRRGKRREALWRVLVRMRAALEVGGVAWRRVMRG